ncbi:MAG: helix-turn-helix domain-containing protein, partial [Chloroflexota bacterium]
MAPEAPAAFGALLRSYRRQAGLSLQALADKAGLSLRGVSDLERGARRHPYPDTIRRLADALGLAVADRTRLVAASQPSMGAPTPPPTGAALLTNLPAALTTFIGREHEVAEVTRRLATCRLLTLTGPGGVGKTRLALAVAAGVSAAGTGDVTFVALAPVRDPALVASAIAQVLGVR